ncbi:hypothetical protein DFP73DRAFT_554356 [Morchella snyderi]|nr:hypothetical protein DFP73DRAFT_554356 [Morchella snyderi]
MHASAFFHPAGDTFPTHLLDYSGGGGGSTAPAGALAVPLVAGRQWGFGFYSYFLVFFSHCFFLGFFLCAVSSAAGRCVGRAILVYLILMLCYTTRTTPGRGREGKMKRGGRSRREQGRGKGRGEGKETRKEKEKRKSTTP